VVSWSRHSLTVDLRLAIFSGDFSKNSWKWYKSKEVEMAQAETMKEDVRFLLDRISQTIF